MNTKNSKHIFTTKRISLNYNDDNTINYQDDSFQSTLYSGGHYFHYRNIFSNQISLNNEHFNLLVETSSSLILKIFFI